MKVYTLSLYIKKLLEQNKVNDLTEVHIDGSLLLVFERGNTDIVLDVNDDSIFTRSRENTHD